MGSDPQHQDPIDNLRFEPELLVDGSVLQMFNLFGEDPVPHREDSMRHHIKRVKQCEQYRPTPPLAPVDSSVQVSVRIKHLITNEAQNAACIRHLENCEHHQVEGLVLQ